MKTLKLTTSQALIKYLVNQKIEYQNSVVPIFRGVFSIFGHGNVAGLGEALYTASDLIPCFRAHNEQAMAHTAIAFAKAHNRKQIMICTSSIGPGATNMVTACALAHVNRLPVLFLPGDTFASRRPDPVLQQIEYGSDPTITANDCFKPVSRFFDRITRAEQLLDSLPHALNVLLDPAQCGPVTLALPQDVQTESFEFPESFFNMKLHHIRQLHPDPFELERAINILKHAKKPLIIAGGGVHYADAGNELALFCQETSIPVAQTQAGKAILAWDHPCNVGGIGVTGTAVANTLAEQADVILVIGSRLQDFTTASHSLFKNPNVKIIQVNVSSYDAIKKAAIPLVADAKIVLRELSHKMGTWCAPIEWCSQIETLNAKWQQQVDKATQAQTSEIPTDAQVLGAVNRFCDKNATIVCAAGGLPGELHKLWRSKDRADYHVEYGYSCMGYEIAGGLGVKLAKPERDVYVLVGDGSYLMLNSEIATSIAMNLKLNIIVLDNGGFGCIHRLQKACGIENFNNLHTQSIDFVQHAQSLGAHAIKVSDIASLEIALKNIQTLSKTCVIVIQTTAQQSSNIGGYWWDVAIPEVSQLSTVNSAFSTYQKEREK